jgi:hypothetical protein
MRSRPEEHDPPPGMLWVMVGLALWLLIIAAILFVINHLV